MKSTVKTRMILAIGETTISRPRELQYPCGTDEHHIVHELYSLQKQGLATFNTRRNVHAPGQNLLKIRLSKRGLEEYRRLRDDK